MLRILTPHHTTPEVSAFRTNYFKNILPELTKKTSVEIIWLVYTPEKLQYMKNLENMYILDIHDYKNALEVIKNVKPDIIWTSPTMNLPDYALTLAGRHMGIPVVGELLHEFFKKESKITMIKSNFGGFFHNSLPSDIGENKKYFMRRGRFFIYKLFFLLKTQHAMGVNIFKILKNLFSLIQILISPMEHQHDPKFSCDLNFIEGEKFIDDFVQLGYKRSSLIPVGNPLLDSMFQQKPKSFEKHSKKICVLLLTDGMYEHGYWTKSQRNEMICNVVKEISKHKDKMDLTVKIHPTNENLDEHKLLINSIDSTIPVFQKENLTQFISNCDVVLAQSTDMAIINSLIFEKPVIMCNFYALEGDILLEHNLAYDCKHPSLLIESIHKVLSQNSVTKEMLDEFVTDYFFKSDGHASQRISDVLLDIHKNGIGKISV